MTTSVLPEPTPVDRESRSRGPLRMIAALSATVIAAGAIAIAVNRDDAAPPRLALATMGSAAEGASARASLTADMSMAAGRVTYVVDGTLPALADHGPVWKLVGVPVDQERVSTWARLLHIDGNVRSLNADGGRGWEVSDSDGSLSVGVTDQGTWVSMSAGVFEASPGSAGDSTSESSSGRISSDGSPSAGATDGSTGSDSGCGVAGEPESQVGTDTQTPTPSFPGEVSEPPAPDAANTCIVDPSIVSTPISEIPSAVPVDLPSAEAAKTIAREALTSMGVLDGEWSFTVNDGGAVSVATESVCGPAVDCAAPQTEEYVISRSVSAKRVVEGTPVDGLEWYVEVGDRGAITSLNGQLVSLERVGEYGLRSPEDALDQLESDGGSGGPVALGAPEPAIAIDCGDPASTCPSAPCPELCPEQPPITVLVTDVALGAQIWFGGEPSAPTQYVVPMYRFTGHTDEAAEWPVQALALNDDALAPPNTDAPVSPSSPDGHTPVPAVEPDAPTASR